jgi:hypothetical protein
MLSIEACRFPVAGSLESCNSQPEQICSDPLFGSKSHVKFRLITPIRHKPAVWIGFFFDVWLLKKSRADIFLIDYSRCLVAGKTGHFAGG